MKLRVVATIVALIVLSGCPNAIDPDGSDPPAKPAAEPETSGDASLSALSIDEAAISPAFDASITEYFALVGESVASVTVQATARQADAEILSGIGAHPVSEGDNEIRIIVAAEDGSTKTYTITITRARVEQSIYEVAFNAGEDAVSVTLGDVQGQSVYLVKANFSDLASSEPHGIHPSQARSDPKYDSRPRLQQRDLKPDFVRQDRPDVAEFNARPAPRSIVETSRSRNTVAGVDRPQMSYAVGATRSFWVDDGPNDQPGVFEEIPVTLRAIGDNSYIWIHDDVLDDTSTATNDNRLTVQQAEDMRDSFEELYTRVANLYGYELGGGPGGDGGMDADQRVSILFYDVQNDYDSGQTGGVLGYFWGKDAYTQAELDGWGYQDLRSNEMEIFYIDSHFTDVWADGIRSTLAHEYQHMIHFNQKSIAQSIASETWFNEMLSMVAEDYLSQTLDTALYNSHPSGRISTYNSWYPATGITDWLDGGNAIYSYASSYLFGAFLVRNYGGAELVSQLSTNDKTGVASINDALQQLGYSDDFYDVMEEYTKLHVYPTGHEQVDRDFAGGIQSFGGISYSLPTFDLFAVGNGPLILNTEDFAGADIRPHGFQVWQQTGWDSISTEELTIELDKPNGNDVRLFLMKK